MVKMRFDDTVTLGSILQTVILVASLFAAYSGIMSRMASVETKVEAMWQHFIKRVKADE